MSHIISFFQKAKKPGKPGHRVLTFFPDSCFVLIRLMVVVIAHDKKASNSLQEY